VVVVRSILFNVLFYLNLIVLLIAAIPTLLMPQRAIIEMAKLWGRTSLWLLRVVCRVNVEWRGVEKIPQGPLIVAAKHQSIWETFSLLPLFDNPTFIIKRELTWIPLFGWFCGKGGMIAVDRGLGSQALTAMTVRAREVIRGLAARLPLAIASGARHEEIEAVLTDLGIRDDRPIVTQVSRFDRLKDPVGVIAPNIQHIIHVHTSENDRGTPGKGHVPWAETFKALKGNGYDGWYVIEAFGRALPGIAEATRVWRDFFPHTDEVYQFGHDFLRSEWAKA